MKVERFKDHYDDFYRGIYYKGKFFVIHPSIEVFVDDEVTVHSQSLNGWLLLKFGPVNDWNTCCALPYDEYIQHHKRRVAQLAE